MAFSSADARSVHAGMLSAAPLSACVKRARLIVVKLVSVSHLVGM